jgi:hypothetical protein
MTTGRTVNKYSRVYIDGYDMSCYARSIGPLSCTFAEGIDDPLCQSITGVWPGQATVNPGTFNGIFDNTSDTGPHAILKTSGTDRDLMVPLGIQAVPAIGDPVFAGQFRQDDYITGPGETPSILTIKFGPTTSGSSAMSYAQPWGVLLHDNSNSTAAYTGLGIDNPTAGATTKGGWMAYQVTNAAGTGFCTAAIKVQDASTNENGDFADLLSTGTINLGSGGAYVATSGVVALATTATVRRFVRWQLALTTATEVTFVLSFHRNYV